jgi:hypothetical protein
VFNRADYLKSKHIPKCQGHIGKFESGYLKLGELPEVNEEDFRMVLSMVGMPLYDANGQALSADSQAIDQSEENQISSTHKRGRSPTKSMHYQDHDDSIAQRKGGSRIPRSSSTAKQAPKRGSLTTKASKRIEDLEEANDT